ncbi:MAG: PAS domain S-box protein, partial [Spirochaetales bacterium]|nr:PAS domain S-box protein [Spirochaetales bacterium]
DNSYVLITDPEGFAVASSRDVPLLDDGNNRIYASNLDDPVFSKVFKVFSNSTTLKSRISEFLLKINNTSYYIQATPYFGPQNLKWQLFVIIPEKDFMAAFYQALTYGIIFLLIFSAIAVYLSYLIAKKTTDPIANLSYMVSRISLKEDAVPEWNIPGKILNRKDEIGTLAHSFNDLEDRLNSTVKYLRQSKKEYKDLVENINSIIMRVKEDGTITYCNPFALNFYGYSEEELIGKSVLETILKTGNPNIFREIFNKNKKYWNGITKNITADGTEVWILWSNAMLLEDDSEKKELLSIGQDITSRKKVEIKLTESLEEKSVLLKEIHHRVKNNLQIVISLINLQLGDISDKKMQEILGSLQNRIQSIALVHEMLYSSDSLNKIDFYDYIFNIVINISATHNRIQNPILVEVKGDRMFLDIERSTTCGLIINELIINAYKHAFIGMETTECRIDIDIAKKKSGKIEISIQDNGKGIDPDAESGMGNLLIEALSDQLNGEISVKNNKGTLFQLCFTADPDTSTTEQTS